MSTRIEIRPSVCPLDCPDTCSLSVTVVDGRIAKVRGSNANPYTGGAVCRKVGRYYPDFVHGPLRLTRPLVRRGPRGTGDFKPVSWDEALDRIHARTAQEVARLGGETVMPLNYAGPHGRLAGGSMAARFFNRLGATRVDRGPLCGAVRGAAYESLFGKAPGMPPEQAEDAELVAVWGNNVTVSNLHLARVIQRARRRGARVAVIDPHRTRIAEQCHLHVQPRPGTDVVLALALAAELEARGAVDRNFIDTRVSGYDDYMNAARRYRIDDAARICELQRNDILALADLYAGTAHIALSIGNGIERGASGGSALRAIMALSVLRGAFGRQGAGVIAKFSPAFPFIDDALERPDLGGDRSREINIVDTSRILLDDTLHPSVNVLFIFNHNPLCTHPDQNRMRRALSREDLFIVGIDVVLTDSMRYADVILPAASHFEHHDLYGSYGHNWLQRAEPVIPPVGESLPNTEIFRRLAARFGFDEPCFGDDDAALIRAAVDPADPRLRGISPDELPTGTALQMAREDGGVRPATSSGRVDLSSADLERRFGCAVPRYVAVNGQHPLMLITPSSSRRTNSTFGGHPDSASTAALEIHPTDAAARGIVDGDAVDAFNDLGRVSLTARVVERVRPGIVYSSKGTWLATSATGQTVNALIDAGARADIMGGACYNDTFVEVVSATRASEKPARTMR